MMKNISLIVCLLLTVSSLIAQERGIASYYSDSFDGRATANGEKYNKNLLTGAHKTLPFGTIVQVTRIDNGKSVKIRINDLGPYISGRIIDISGKAAEILGLKSAPSGTAEVVLKVIGKSDIAPAVNGNSSSTLPPTPTLNTTKKKEQPKEYTAPEKPVVKKEKPVAKQPKKEILKKESKKTTESGNIPKKEEKPRPQVTATSNESIKYSSATNFKPGKGYKFEIKTTKEKLFGVQVAAVKDIDGMMTLVAKYQSRWFDDVFVNVDKVNGETVYKIILGAFKDQKKAGNYKRSLKKRKKIDGFVVPIL